jgi:hypothetical protein
VIGKVEILYSNDVFPFKLGVLEKEAMQTAISNRLFIAPLFLQPPPETDFILIRTKVDAKLLTFTLREINRVFVAGQIEPCEVII